MAPFPLSLFLLRRRSSPFSYPFFFRKPPLFSQISSQPQSLPFPTASLPLPKEPPDSSDPKSNLSARLSFVFDQIDAIDRDRSQKDDALQRIRAWRQTKHATAADSTSGEIVSSIEEKKEEGGLRDLFLKKDVEVVHPWPEWIELMERLGQQNYFDHRRVDEDTVAENVGIDLSGVKEEVGFDFSRDWTTVRNACMNFGRDRFDILRSLSRKDLQILVGHGCPSMDPKVVFSAKLLRKHVHLDEGDVCSSCSLRNSCGRGYLLTRKEDEARTLDVVRILLTFGFDHVNGSVENKPLMKMKSVKTVVRKLLHEVVKLSAVPIDPNLPPPVIKKPPPKVKQPPPPPKKRVGRDDVEMKKGDWLCPKCDFMNFAKNTVCLQCDAKRPKRQLLPGEWECPQCNFLNYRRNMACFHCDAKRPPDEFMENQLQAKQSGPRMRLERAARMPDVSNAWNFDFDDNESDGADVAAFESADSPKMGEDSSLDDLPHGIGGFEDDTRMARTRERGRYLSDYDERKSTVHSDRTGFDDFDDEEDDDVDSYELDGLNNNQAHEVSRKNFSEVDDTSGSEDFDDLDRHTNFNRGAKDYLSGSEDDDLVDHPHWKSSHVADSWKKAERRGGKSLGSDDDIELSSDNDDDVDEGCRSKQRKSRQQSSGRKGISRRGRDSDSDDGNLYSSRNKMRGNKGLSDRRMNNFMEHSESGSARRGEFRSDNRKSNRRNSFGNHSNDFSSRGSRGDGYGGRRENDRVQRFDRLDDGDRNCGRANQFGDRSSGSRRDERGSRGDGYGGRRENDRFQRFDRLDDGDRNRGRANQFGDRSRGSRRDERGSRGDGYGASWRRDDGFRRGRSNSFSDQGRSFNDDNDNDRPRRWVIER